MTKNNYQDFTLYNKEAPGGVFFILLIVIGHSFRVIYCFPYMQDWRTSLMTVE